MRKVWKDMMILVIGGSGSGKSAYAEKIAASFLSEDVPLYYLATMQVYDREGQEKADRHRKLRRGKGFYTIEQPKDISLAIEKMEGGKGIVLLECISNLTANEMFSEEKPKSAAQVTEKIIREIKAFKEITKSFVIVSNNVFEDGIVYDKPITEYIHVMGQINQMLASMADQVVEVVAGLPVFMKQ